MRATIDGEVLSEALKRTASVANSRVLLALNSVLIETGDKSVTLTGGNGDTFVRTTVEAAVDVPGKILVPAKTAAKTVSLMSGDVAIEAHDKSVELSTLWSNVSLNTGETDKYPTFPEPDGDSWIDVTEFWGILPLITYASDTSNHQPARRRSVTFFKGYAEAFDGNRLARCVGPEIESALLRTTVEHATKHLSGTIEMNATEAGAWFRDSNGTELWSTVPQFERMPLPEPPLGPHAIVVDRRGLIEGISLMQVVKDREEIPVRMDLVGDILYLTARSEDGDNVTTQVEAQGTLGWASGLTASHARDAFTRCASDEITLQFGESQNKPIKVTDGKVTHLLAPNMVAVKENPHPTGGES